MRYAGVVVALMVVAVLFASAGRAQHDEQGHGRWEGHHNHRFEDAEAWAKRFDDPERDEWQKPGETLAALGLAKNARLADVGSATGYFATRAARTLPKGRVWGVDIEPDMVRYLRERAQTEKLGNLYSILGLPDDPLLPEPVDLILIVDTYHHIEQREDYFRKLKAYLRPGGRIAIVDFKKGDFPVGPPDAMKLTEAEVTGELASAGYKKLESHGFLPYQHFMIYGMEP